MKGILSFEMIRAGADVLRDAGVSQETADAVFEAINGAAQPDIIGKPTRKPTDGGLTSSSTPLK